MSSALRLSAGDDDFDLRGSGSGISALFASAEPAGGSMSSLAFQRQLPPQPPKPKPAPAPAADSPPLTLFASLVNAFQSVEGAWQSVGQAGLAIVGGPLPKPITLVLYEPTSKRQYSITSLQAGVALGVPSPQYIVLADDAGQSWSMHLPTPEACSNLLQHATHVRSLLAMESYTGAV